MFGAHLRITALRAGSGPGIELLEYLSPTDGRAYPANATANDLVHWETRFVTEDEESSKTNPGRTLVAWEGGRDRTKKDPDGHVLVLRMARKMGQTQQDEKCFHE